MTTPLRLGHRGHRLAGWDESENTLAAFDRALAAGCDGLEFDLRPSGDGRIVVHHDDELRFHGAIVPVADASLRALRRLHPALATFDQVLRRYRNVAWLDCELKSAAAASGVVEALRRWPPRRGCVVSSFDPDVLAIVARLDPALPRCLNLRRPCSWRRLRAADVSWVAPHQAACTAWSVRRMRAMGWRVLVWTVNHPRRMRLLARAGADAIVSDDPYLLVQTLPAAAVAEQTR